MLPLRSPKKTGGVTRMAVSWILEHVRPERKINYGVGDAWRNGGNHFCLFWIWPDGFAVIGRHILLGKSIIAESMGEVRLMGMGRRR